MPSKEQKLKGDFPVPQGELHGDEYITPTLTRKSAPEQLRLPELADMRNMSRAELMDVLSHFGVVAPWGALQTEASKYIMRMTELRPGTPEFQAELERLTEVDSDRGLLGLSRRTTQQWSSWDAIDGDINKEMLWLTEMGEGVCDNCAVRGGTIQTFAQWQIDGAPGAAVCQGGDYCRCDLLVVG